MPRLEYDLNITGADNGCIVRIGCKTLVFNDLQFDEMFEDIKTFIIEGPSKGGAKYFGWDDSSDTWTAGIARAAVPQQLNSRN